MRIRIATRVLAVVTLGLFGAGLAAGPALAHVSVTPGTAAPGGHADLSFRVPNESDDAFTVQVEIELPKGKKFEDVSVEPVVGWTVTTRQSGKTVTSVVWRNGKIEPGQFQRFEISLAGLPKTTDPLVFKALQTYSNGEVVRWIETPQPGGEEPEYPAPVLMLSKSATTSGEASGDQDSSSTSVTPAATEHTGPDGFARLLGGCGLALGAASLAIGLVARRNDAQPEEAANKPAEPVKQPEVARP
jgi:uncharacterized protein YcnI